MKGQLWVIEGTDGSGKATQTRLLIDRLNNSGILNENQAQTWSFPTYEDPVWGKLIKEYLSAAGRKAEDFDPRYASLLYAADRGKAAAKFGPLLQKGDWIICDRYTQSNMAFQGAKIEDVQKRDEFVDWLEKQEYEFFQVPRPTGIIFLSLPVEISRKRTDKRLGETDEKNIGGKVKKTDIHEQDRNYMERVREEYYRLAKMQGWHIVECVENGRELTPEEINEKIWEIIKPK